MDPPPLGLDWTPRPPGRSIAARAGRLHPRGQGSYGKARTPGKGHRGIGGNVDLGAAGQGVSGIARRAADYRGDSGGGDWRLRPVPRASGIDGVSGLGAERGLQRSTTTPGSNHPDRKRSCATDTDRVGLELPLLSTTIPSNSQAAGIVAGGGRGDRGESGATFVESLSGLDSEGQVFAEGGDGGGERVGGIRVGDSPGGDVEGGVEHRAGGGTSGPSFLPQTPTSCPLLWVFREGGRGNYGAGDRTNTCRR